MPARTGVEMGLTFSGTLKVDNSAWQNDLLWVNPAPQSAVTASLLGCTASITGGDLYTSVEVLSNNPPSLRVHRYYKYTVRAQVGLSTQSADVYSYCGNFVTGVLFGTTLPAGATVVSNILEVPFAFVISGIYAGTSVTDAEYTDRMSPKDYTDRTLETGWYADENTSCIVIASVPTVGDLTATKNDITAPNSIDPQYLGSNFACRWGLSLNYAPVTDTTLAAVVNPQFSAADANLAALNLHNPGTGETPPDAITANWYYSPPSSGAYWHVYNDSGIAIERCGATTTSNISWAGATSLPYLVSLVFNDGAFSDEAGNDLAIEYDCGAIEWDPGTGAYIPHYFTGNEDYDEWHSDWDPPGWRRWNYTHTVSATETDAWRTANGEV